MKESIRTLLVELRYPHQVSYYTDWTDAFSESPFFSECRLNLATLQRKQLARDIEEFDLIVLLHSCIADTTDKLAQLASVLRERKRAKLIAFVGNEYNSLYTLMSAKISTLRAIRPDVIATQLLEEAGHYLYRGTGARVASVPHAFNPAVFQSGPPDAERSIDIGVRGFHYSPLLGDQDRNYIVEHFRLSGRNYGLRTDIDTQNRFDRLGWARFLASCRGTVSSEAGSCYLDRDDGLVKRVKSYLDTKRPAWHLDDTVPGRGLVRHLPLSIKAVLRWLLQHGPIKYAAFEDSKLDFEDIYERFFKNAPKCPAYSKAISSRHFDAIGTRTCQILIKGRYNDILSAGEHYIPVAPNLSNICDAVAGFKDKTQRERIATAAYEHVMSGHTYAHRTRMLYELAHKL